MNVTNTGKENIFNNLVYLKYQISNVIWNVPSVNPHLQLILFYPFISLQMYVYFPGN